MERPGPGEKPIESKGFSPWRLIPLGILAAGLVAFFAFDLDRYVGLDALKQHHAALKSWVAARGFSALLIFGAVYALVVAFSLPGGAVMTVAGGFMFGAVAGTVTVVISATIGACAVFLAARYAIGDLLRAKAGPSLKKLEAGFREDAFSYLLVLRLVPLFPFWLVNLAPAFLGVPFGIYALGTLIGIVPGTVVFILVGRGADAVLDKGGDIDLGIIFEPHVLAPIVGLAVLALVPVVYKRWKARHGTGGPA